MLLLVLLASSSSKDKAPRTGGGPAIGLLQLHGINSTALSLRQRRPFEWLVK
jgi:hypothetical protein